MQRKKQSRRENKASLKNILTIQWSIQCIQKSNNKKKINTRKRALAQTRNVGQLLIQFIRKVRFVCVIGGQAFHASALTNTTNNLSTTRSVATIIRAARPAEVFVVGEELRHVSTKERFLMVLLAVADLAHFYFLQTALGCRWSGQEPKIPVLADADGDGATGERLMNSASCDFCELLMFTQKLSLHFCSNSKERFESYKKSKRIKSRWFFDWFFSTFSSMLTTLLNSCSCAVINNVFLYLSLLSMYLGTYFLWFIIFCK